MAKSQSRKDVKKRDRHWRKLRTRLRGIYSKRYADAVISAVPKGWR